MEKGDAPMYFSIQLLTWNICEWCQNMHFEKYLGTSIRTHNPPR